MKTLIENCQKALQKRDNQRQRLDDLDRTKARLISEEANLLSQLAGLGPEQLAAGSLETGHFDETTALKVQALRDIQTKKELVPAVRSQLEADIQQINIAIHQAATKLRRYCERESDTKLQALHDKLMGDLAPICGKDTNRLRESVLSVVLKSDQEQWRLCFRTSNAGSNPIAAAKDAVELAQQWEQGLPCPDALDRSSPLDDMSALISARGRF
jgi:hypothetical protein